MSGWPRAATTATSTGSCPSSPSCGEPYGYEVYDFSYMPDTLDEEYVDGYHGSDRVYARLALHLAEESETLAGLIDTDYLNAALAPSSSPLRLAE